MLAFPGVIYSQPLYFEWLSPGITEDTSERKGEKETGRRRRRKRVATEWATGEKGKQDRPLQIRLTGWRVAGMREDRWRGENSGWLAGFYYWQLGGIAYCFPFYLLLQSLASFRFTSFYLRERTRICVSVRFFHSPRCLHRANDVWVRWQSISKLPNSLLSENRSAIGVPSVQCFVQFLHRAPEIYDRSNSKRNTVNNIIICDIYKIKLNSHHIWVTKKNNGVKLREAKNGCII